MNLFRKKPASGEVQNAVLQNTMDIHKALESLGYNGMITAVKKIKERGNDVKIWVEITGMKGMSEPEAAS